jgi:hypothetical protein
MLFLSFDIHQDNMGSGEQDYIYPLTEFQCFQKLYLNVILKVNAKANLFVTAESFLEHRESYLDYLDDGLIKIGAHGYDAYRFNYLHRLHPMRLPITRKILNKFRKYALQSVERLDVKKTLGIMRKDIEVDMWRTHGYRSSPSLYRILKENEITFISDRKCLNIDIEFNRFGLTEYYINTPPDHEHLIHGPQCTEHWGGDVFGNKRKGLEEYFQLLIESVSHNKSLGLNSTILLHPNCQYIADDSLEILHDTLQYLKSIDDFCWIG